MEFSSLVPVLFLISCIFLCTPKVKACSTIDGNTCVFPFVYRGEIYNRCHFNNSDFLCATLQSNSTHPAKSLSKCSVSCLGDATMLGRFHPKFVRIHPRKNSNEETDKDSNEETDKDSNKETDKDSNEKTDKDSNEKTDKDSNEETDKESNEETDKDSNEKTDKDEKKEEENQEGEDDCTTISGLNCVFPFKYKGEEFKKCTNRDSEFFSWCATAVDFVTNEYTNYGLCSKDCKMKEVIPSDQCATIDGIKCEFPFKYNGETYTECTIIDNSGIPWCATEVNDEREYVKHGICRSVC